MTDIDLNPPAFLSAARRATAPRPRRWKRIKVRRPEGKKWEAAQRWEVTFGPEHSYTKPNGRTGGLAAGTRCVWVIVGRKRVEIRDAEDKCVMTLAEWRLLERHGRQVET